MGYETYYLQFMNQALELVLVFKRKGNVVFANSTAYKLLEYNTDELLEIDIPDVFPTIFDKGSDGITWKEGYGQDAREAMAYRKNKTCFSVQLKIFSLGDDESFACMALDTSDKAYYEHKISVADAQMENAEAMRTQFVANITHELRTPVNGILGNIQNLQRNETDLSKLSTMRLIERGCNDMHSLINNILDYSKLSAGKMELDPGEFTFRDMMEYVRSNHINKIAEKGLDFFVNISPEVPERVIGDELRIGQILNNLLSNATKFTTVGKIMVEVVKTAQRGNDVELFFMVMDTGIGISKENQDKLFKSFSQVEASIFRRFGGTGLGLNISKQLVELMGGSIHVESEPGKGSVFSFHVWLSVPGGEEAAEEVKTLTYTPQMPAMTKLDIVPSQEFGTKENIEEIDKKMSKLILCIEMENWDKAEMFMEAIKTLSMGAPQAIRSSMLKLKMAVQKGDRDKTVEAYDNFRNALDNRGECD